MADLTPYDTGARLEPVRWVTPTDDLYTEPDIDRWGRVDFDNEESATVVTVHIEHQGVGRTLLPDSPRYILKLENVSEPIIIHGPGGEYLGTVKPDEGEHAPQADPRDGDVPQNCLICGRAVHTNPASGELVHGFDNSKEA